MSTMLKRLLNLIPHTTIDGHGSPYLTRYYLLGRDWNFGGVFLHHFHRSDLEAELHSHPWPWGISFILAGGYTQQSCDVKTPQNVRIDEFEPGSINVIRNGVYHKVTLHDERDGCWSIFVVGRREQEWDFLDTTTGARKHRSAVNPGSIA